MRELTEADRRGIAVARYAEIDEIAVRERGRTLTLTIRDNGRGITSAERSSVESIGLLGMTERARLLGGRLSIAGAPGRGTTITANLPRTQESTKRRNKT